MRKNRHDGRGVHVLIHENLSVESIGMCDSFGVPVIIQEPGKISLLRKKKKYLNI